MANRIRWTSDLVSTLLNYHARRSNQSISSINRSFAREYKVGFNAVTRAFYKYRHVRPVTSMVTPTQNITFQEALNVYRFAQAAGYTIVG